jgi:mitogen-activated protein kinase kinase kinase
MAPEVVKQTGHTRKADIWSVGCLVVEMLTGEHPWAQLTQMQAIFKVINLDFIRLSSIELMYYQFNLQIGSSARPTIPSDISADAQDFLRRTFEIDHEARPSAAELLQHAWVVPPKTK